MESWLSESLVSFPFQCTFVELIKFCAKTLFTLQQDLEIHSIALKYTASRYTPSRYRLLQDGSFVFWQLTYSVTGIFCFTFSFCIRNTTLKYCEFPVPFSAKVTCTLASVWLPNSKDHDYIIDYHNFMVIIMSDIRRLFIPTHFVASSSWHNRKKSKLLSGKACLIFPKVIKFREVIHNGTKVFFNWQLNSISWDIFDVIFNIYSKYFVKT